MIWNHPASRVFPISDVQVVELDGLFDFMLHFLFFFSELCEEPVKYYCFSCYGSSDRSCCLRGLLGIWLTEFPLLCALRWFEDNPPSPLFSLLMLRWLSFDAALLFWINWLSICCYQVYTMELISLSVCFRFLRIPARLGSYKPLLYPI